MPLKTSVHEPKCTKPITIPCSKNIHIYIYILLFFSEAPIDGRLEEEEEEEEVMLDQANLEAVPQIALKGAEEELKVEEVDASPGPSGLAEASRPDEEQAGLGLGVCVHARVFVELN